MRLCSFVQDRVRASGLVLGDEIIELGLVNRLLGLTLSTDLSNLVKRGELDVLRRALVTAGDRLKGRGVDPASLKLVAPYVDPPKIWCIGLNYVEHAADLNSESPDEPASFMRPATSICGPGEPICLPPESARTTGEAELAVVIGRRCKYVTPECAEDVVAGFLPAIDMTAEDLLRRNPRFLTRAKSFDTFLSLGSFLVTPDEIGGLDRAPACVVSTLLNGEVKRSNFVGNMRHDIRTLIAFHSRVMTWEAGDILLTGTPGAVPLALGDVIGCQISGIGALENPVTALPADGWPMSLREPASGH